MSTPFCDWNETEGWSSRAPLFSLLQYVYSNVVSKSQPVLRWDWGLTGSLKPYHILYLCLPETSELGLSL